MNKKGHWTTTENTHNSQEGAVKFVKLGDEMFKNMAIGGWRERSKWCGSEMLCVIAKELRIDVLPIFYPHLHNQQTLEGKCFS